MKKVTNRKLTTKTKQGISDCIAEAQERLGGHKERRAATTGENPGLDNLIDRLEGYIRRRKIDSLLF
jgi:hypothetical protein